MVQISEYASNTPVSRPVNPGWTVDWDLGGMQWSYEHGMFYDPADEFVPLRKPSPRVNE